MPTLSLHIFGWRSRLLWLATAVALSTIELTPFHSEGVPAPLFYSYQALKCASFVLLGFETPLAFWRFDNIAKGLLVAWIPAAIVEVLQSRIVGHRFSFFELTAKFLLIFMGFVVGIVVRYDEALAIGPFHIRLTPVRKPT